MLHRVGRGALARIGNFWYPIRLIQYKEKEKVWLVRWWRGCSFEAPESLALVGSITAVSESDIVDSLMGRSNGPAENPGKWALLVPPEIN